jgi:hypothetical protein
MSLPATVRVKLSTEAAGAITITPVVVRDMPVRDLIELMLPSGGKDVKRIRRLIEVGNFVAGGSRLRWQGWDAAASDVEEILSTFPDPDPAMEFAPSRCVAAVLCGEYVRIELDRQAANRKRLLRRSSFWDHILGLARLATPRYHEYSYRDRADCFRLTLSPSEVPALRRAARLLPYSTLARQIESAIFDYIDLFVKRPG